MGGGVIMQKGIRRNIETGMEEHIVRIDEKDCQIIQAILIDQFNVIENEIKRLTQNREMIAIQLRKIRGEDIANNVPSPEPHSGDDTEEGNGDYTEKDNGNDTEKDKG